MTKEVGWLLEADVRRGERDAMVELIREMSNWSARNEPGTLSYEWWMSTDGTTGHLHERYENSEAALTHLRFFRLHFAERMMSLVNSFKLSVYGQPSEDVKQALGDVLPVEFERVGGFVR